MYLVGLEVQLLKGLGIEHTHKEIQRCVVTVGNDTVDGLFPFTQLIDLHSIVCCDCLDLRECKGSQPDSSAHKNTLCRFSCGLFEYLVLPNSDMLRLFFLQCFKEKIQRGLEIIVVLFRSTVFDHGQHHFHCLLLRGSFMEKIQHQGTVQRNFRLFPKGIVLCCVLGGSVLDKVIDQPEYIGILTDIPERVVMVGMAGVN